MNKARTKYIYIKLTKKRYDIPYQIIKFNNRKQKYNTKYNTNEHATTVPNVYPFAHKNFIFFLENEFQRCDFTILTMILKSIKMNNTKQQFLKIHFSNLWGLDFVKN